MTALKWVKNWTFVTFPEPTTNVLRMFF